MRLTTCSFLAILLHRQQFAIHSAFSFEFGMRAFLHKPSLVHHDDLMGIADGLQVVGNDQDRAVSDKGGHRLLYFVLIDGIDVASVLPKAPSRSLRFSFCNHRAN